MNGDGFVTKAELLDGLIEHGLNVHDYLDANVSVLDETRDTQLAMLGSYTVTAMCANVFFYPRFTSLSMCSKMQYIRTVA